MDSKGKTASALSAVPEFDALHQLFCDNPSEFEIVRHRLLQEAVEMQAERHRPGARRLLEKMESVRSGAASPLEAAGGAFMLMLDSYSDLQRAMSGLQHERAYLETIMLINRAKRGFV
jgi:hypothetical protein